MGTGFSLDPNEYRAAAAVIEGYGSMQADHGTALATATSTPLSSSGSGIAGAISTIAQGAVQKIVTDVTSTTQGFANDTATGLRTQANAAERLETSLVGNADSVLADAGSILPNGAASGVGGSSFGANGQATSFGGGTPLVTDTPSASAPLGGTTTGSSELGVIGADEPGLDGAGSGSGGAGAGSDGLESPQQSSAMEQLGELRGSTRAGASGAGEERGQRPAYLKSGSEPSRSDEDRMKTAVDKHRRTCGVAPIPFAANRLVCAKCGTVVEVGDAQSLSA